MAAQACSKAASWSSLSRSKISCRTAATCRAPPRGWLGPGLGERDEGASPVGRALLPLHQPAALHAGELMRQPALLPVQRVADLERPQPLPAASLSCDEHLVLRQVSPESCCSCRLSGGRQQRAHPQVGTPRPLFVFAEPRPGHTSSIAREINDGSFMSGWPTARDPWGLAQVGAFGCRGFRLGGPLAAARRTVRRDRCRRVAARSRPQRRDGVDRLGDLRTPLSRS